MAYYRWRSYLRDVAVTCAGSMAMGLGLAMLADMALSKKAQAFGERQMIEDVAERLIGARVLWARGLTNGCEENLLGFYHPARRRVVMCERNLDNSIPRMLTTLRHEVWHSAQHLCNGNRAVLSDERLRRGMSGADKRILRSGYKPKDQRLEAEARVIGKLPTKNFIDGVRHYCRHRM